MLCVLLANMRVVMQAMERTTGLLVAVALTDLALLVTALVRYELATSLAASLARHVFAIPSVRPAPANPLQRR